MMQPVGGELNLFCKAHLDRYHVRVSACSWQKSDKEQPCSEPSHVAHGCDLHFRRLVEEHTGDYRCTAVITHFSGRHRVHKSQSYQLRVDPHLTVDHNFSGASLLLKATVRPPLLAVKSIEWARNLSAGHVIYTRLGAAMSWLLIFNVTAPMQLLMNVSARLEGLDRLITAKVDLELKSDHQQTQGVPEMISTTTPPPVQSSQGLQITSSEEPCANQPSWHCRQFSVRASRIRPTFAGRYECIARLRKQTLVARSSVKIQAAPFPRFWFQYGGFGEELPKRNVEGEHVVRLRRHMLVRCGCSLMTNASVTPSVMVTVVLWMQIGGVRSYSHGDIGQNSSAIVTYHLNTESSSPNITVFCRATYSVNTNGLGAVDVLHDGRVRII